MSDKPEATEEKKRVGILRKRDTSAGLSTTLSSTKINVTSRLKPRSASTKPPAKSATDESGSIFSKRTKIVRDKPATAPVSNKHTSPRVSVSTCHSTTTLDSRTAASQSSITHKPGHLPAYLRNKSGVASKSLIAVQVQCNKKQFYQIKKELTDIQNKAVDYYKRYRESLVKLNKLNGKDEAPTIEELKIVDFIEKPKEAVPAVEPITAKPLNGVTLPAIISLSKLRQITNEGLLEKISQQVQSIQVHSYKLLQEFSKRLSEISDQIKSSENTESGDMNLLSNKIQNLFQEIEKKTLEEESQHSSRINTFMSNLKEMMINDEGTPLLMKDAIPEEYEIFKKESQLQIMELENRIKELELKKIHEEHKNADLLKTVANERDHVNELQCMVTQCKVKREEKDKEIERLMQKLKQLELNNKRSEKLLESKANEISLKDKSIAELKNSIKSTQDKLLKITNQSQKFENKLSRAEEDSQTQLKKIKSKYDAETKLCDQLRKELNDLNASVADNNKPLRDENERLKYNEAALEKEIYNLKLSLTEMMHSKTLIEKAKIEEEVYRREMSHMEEEICRMKTTINELQDDLNKRDLLLSKKTREITDLEVTIKQLEQRDKVKEYKTEIKKLQDLNNQKTKENEELKHDLDKAISDLRLQEESLFMQQRLLKIRSELIQSLQDNEDASKSHLAELNSEIDKKTYLVKQLNLEVSSKSEELENLFSTLGAKNIEVKRQDHMIKLLEETHTRNQTIRVKQEERIARLENENAELKRFIQYKPQTHA